MITGLHFSSVNLSKKSNRMGLVEGWKKHMQQIYVNKYINTLDQKEMTV